MKEIRTSSLWFQLAYFPRLQFQRERKLGRFLIGDSTTHNHDGSVNEPDPRFLMPAQVSLCQLFWRALLSPVIIATFLAWTMVKAALIFVLLPVLVVAFLYIAGLMLYDRVLWLGHVIASCAQAVWVFTVTMGHVVAHTCAGWAHTIASYGWIITSVLAVVVTALAIARVLRNRTVIEVAEITSARFKAYKERRCPILTVIES